MESKATNPAPALPANSPDSGAPPDQPHALPGQNVRLGMGLLFLAFSWPVIKMLVNVFEHNPDYSHGYVVPIVALYALHLGWTERNRVPARASWLGLPLVLMGMSIMIFGSWVKVAIHHDGLGTEFLSAAGIVTAIWGMMLSLFGLRRCGYFAFPLLYLLFAIPFPESVTLKITLPMREIISIAAGRLISLVGIHVYQEGNLLHLAGASLGVEDACSGIRSLWAMLAGSVAIAYVARCTRWQMVVVTLIAVPLAMLQNLARVFITAILVHHLDIKYAEGWRHETVGWITFILAGILLFYLALRISAKTYAQYLKQPKTEGLLAPSPPPQHYRTTARPVYLSLALLLAVGTAAQAAIYFRYNNNQIKSQILADYEARSDLDTFPVKLGKFTLREPSRIPDGQMKMLDPADYFGGVYEDQEGNLASILMFYWRPSLLRTDDIDKHPHTPEICMPAGGFVKSRLENFPIVPEAQTEGQIVARYSNDQQQMVVVYWRSPSRLFRSMPYKDRLYFLKKSWSEPMMRNGSEFSVGLYVPVTTTPDEALDTALQLAREMAPHLEAFGLEPSRFLPDPGT